LVKCLNGLSRCYFRKTSDRAQVGLPDIIGIVGGRHVEIEVKHEKVLDTAKRVPTGTHPFTGAQRKELAHAAEAGAAAIGIVACGNHAFAFPASYIGEDGRICLDEHRGQPQLVMFTLPDVRSLVCLIKDSKN
jgi:hypothetical protein